MKRFIFWSVLTPIGACVWLSFYTVQVEALGQPGGNASSGAWVQAHHTRARLIADEGRGVGLKSGLRAGIHIELDPGWKTYWRTPGGAGGVPPYFDWTGSKNLKSAKVLYPAPKRIPGEDGVSIGYKKEVVFPVKIVPLDESKPVELALQIDYGVCKDICVPVQSRLKLGLGKSPGAVRSAGVDGQLLKRFAERVPGEAGAVDADRPKLHSIKINFDDRQPELIVEADYPMGAEGADLFVEAPEGLYIPLPRRISAGDQGRVRFRIDLSKGEAPELLRGKELRLTFVGMHGCSETGWRVPMN